MTTASYNELAQARTTSRWTGYKQPEDFGYKFHDWISPYTKGACAHKSIAIVLQDWSSEEKLQAGIDPDVQRLGRSPVLKTNKTLERLLEDIFGLSFDQIYATNIFPFIKLGKISAPLPMRDVRRAASEFTVRELEIARPSKILALGRVSSQVLQSIGVDCIALPHPAARIGAYAKHKNAWLDALN